jgi:flagellar biosynthesis/type III secretory pathway chaperone
MSLDPSDCRDQFARHLAEEVALLKVLEEQLRGEHALLVANDVEGLEQAGAARQESVARLLRIHDARNRLCRARQLATDPQGLAALLAWCDPEGSLAGAQAECAMQARRCREQNERNGALVTARLNRVGSMLGMICGEPASETYQSRAAVRAVALASAGRMLSTSA